METKVRSEIPPGEVNELGSNRKEVLCGSENVSLDGGSTWTDEKHNSYLTHLEVSFVQQLNHSKGFLDHTQRDMKISHTRPDGQKTYEQFTVLRNGCWQKITYERREPISRTSATSPNLLNSPWIYRFRRNGMHSDPSSAAVPECLDLPAEKYGEGIATCSHQSSLNNPSHDDLLELSQEGMGENVLDEESQKKTESQPQAKRLKIAVEHRATKDQIVPDGN